MRASLTFLLSIIFSCQNSQNAMNNKTDFTVYPTSVDTSWYGKYFTDEMRMSKRLLNLPDLSKGIQDSMEIRIWRREFLDWSKNVLVFKLDNKGWNGFHYNSWTMPLEDYNGQTFRFQGQPEIGDSVFIVKEIVPKCGWQKFSDSIYFFQIPVLPTQDSIKDFKYISHTDGNNYSFEIATSVSYRNLFYDFPDHYQYKECKLVVKFLAMLERQLGSDYNWPWQWRSKK
jgi:hypothetical protein